MRFSYAESMTDPSYYLPLAQAAEEAGYDSMVVPDSICYPEALRHHLSVQPGRDPGVPRGQAVPRAVLAHPGHGSGDRADPLRHVRDQASDPPAGPYRQAGQLYRRAHGQPPSAGRGHQPVARGLRDLRGALGAPGQANGRGDRRHARAHGRRVLRVPRRGLRRALDKDVPDAESPRSDPDRRAPRGRPPARPPSTATGGCTVAATLPTCRACSTRLAELRTTADRTQALRDARHLPRCLQSRRSQALGGARCHRRHRRLPLALRRPSTDTEPLQTKIDSLRRFADDVIAKVR